MCVCVCERERGKERENGEEFKKNEYISFNYEQLHGYLLCYCDPLASA